MTDTTQIAIDEIPYFPAPAPAVFSDPAASAALILPVLHALSTVVDPADDPALPTPCRGFSLGQLRDHTLGWLQHFAAALADPERTVPRADPTTYTVADDPRPPAEVVLDSARRIDDALAAGVLARRVVMSQSVMDGSAVVAMALGEYLVHGWDLARATGRPWAPSADACDAAREFLEGMITPDYRAAAGEDGPDTFFGPEVVVPADAPALDRLLGFAGRDPRWTA